MSDVIQFERAAKPAPPKKAPTLETHFGNDHWILEMCAKWRAARAQQQKNWAEHELATGWGYLKDSGIPLDMEPLRRMGQFEKQLACSEPRTILLAREMLGVCVTILAYQNEDPEGALAQGPVLEIVRSVVKSLEYVDGNTPIGEFARGHRKKRRKGTHGRRKAAG